MKEASSRSRNTTTSSDGGKKRKGEDRPSPSSSRKGAYKKVKVDAASTATVTGRPFYNTVACQETLKSKKGQPCPHMAYFVIPGIEKYVCGQHSMHLDKVRVKLAKDPQARPRRLAELEKHRLSIEEYAEKNASPGLGPNLKCFQMKMMGEVPLEEGYMNVFPNNKHQHREDGYGCSSLSPMQLGPVLHRQPGLPPSLNIENYHQFNKVWPCEVDDDGNPKDEYYVMRRKGYEDPEPHRHKFDAKTMKRMREELKTASVPGSLGTSENRNQPCYSIHLTLDGEERRFTYVQSRYFYCCAYEALAKKTQAFKRLLYYFKWNYSLTICGYDAYPVTKKLYEHYCDPSKPFGHELVLYTLLAYDGGDDGDRDDDSDPDSHYHFQYPWHRYRKEHPEVYDGIASVLIEDGKEIDEHESK